MSATLIRFWRSMWIICALGAVRSAGAQCQDWSRDFAPDGVDQSARASLVFDDGSGPKLYVGGEFSRAGAIAAQNVARWNGSGWQALGSGTNGAVYALAVFDDGSGPALYVGGVFSSAGGVGARHVAKWNGLSWSTLGSGTDGEVDALFVFDDGAGPALYAGGRFTTAGGSPALSVAKWNGSSWSPLGDGFIHGPSNMVSCFAAFDDGTGPALYAGGVFDFSGSTFVRCIGKWDGTSWSNVGGGVDAVNPAVNALKVFDDGTGPALYAAGGFDTAGGTSVHNIARWNGSTWSSVGAGIGTVSEPYLRALEVYDEGSGPALHAGGEIAGGVFAWNGSQWTAVGTGFTAPNSVQHPAVFALTAYDDGRGPALFAGGQFDGASGIRAKNKALRLSSR
jgi:hypothetical protein